MDENLSIPYKISVFYTNICNLNCKHCYVAPLFNEKNVMTDSILSEVIEVANMWGVKRITITGGEPLIFWDKLKKHTKRMYDNEIACHICTNASWANSEEATLKLLSSFKENGVSCLELSTDSYHQEYVPLGYIERCIKLSKAMGIKTIVTICSDKIDNELFTIAKLSEIVENKKDLRFQYTAEYGNAEINGTGSKLEPQKIKNKMCKQIGQPLVMYSGDVYACCGPPIIAQRNSSLYMGNFEIHKAKEYLKHLNENPKILKIKNEGPLALLESNDCTFSSLCDICCKGK